MRIHHLGIATDDGDALATLLSDLLSASVVHEETFEGLSVAFLDLGNGYLELLEPVEDDGTVARFLDRRGPGLHHVAVGVEDVAAALDRARESGAEPIDDSPRPGAWGHEVAFLHPRSTGGVLIEFVGA